VGRARRRDRRGDHRGAALGGLRIRDEPAHAATVRRRLEEATQGGYQTFWWIVTLLLLSLPFLVGFGVAKLSAKSLVIVGAIVALFIIAIMVLGQLFIF